MTAAELIMEARRCGANLVIADRKLKTAPRGKLPPGLKAEIRERADEVKARLRAEQEEREINRLAETDGWEPLSKPGSRAYESCRYCDATLVIVRRLKAYTLPEGRMPAVRSIAERLKPLLTVPGFDTVEALRALQTVERELTELGGRCDPELAEAIELVTSALPGARLVKLTQ